MSSLPTTCPAIRKSVKPPHPVTYETVWKVWLHRLNLTSPPLTNSNFNLTTIFLSVELSSFNFLRGSRACGAEFESLRGFGEETCLCNQRGMSATHIRYCFLLEGVVPYLTLTHCTFFRIIFHNLVHAWLLSFSDQCPDDQSASSHGG